MQIYETFIRPVLEYTSEIFDGCSVVDSKKLENLQVDAAWVTAGLPLFVSSNALYPETGLETIIDRRKAKKLCTMYKMLNDRYQCATQSWRMNLLQT